MIKSTGPSRICPEKTGPRSRAVPGGLLSLATIFAAPLFGATPRRDPAPDRSWFAATRARRAKAPRLVRGPGGIVKNCGGAPPPPRPHPL